MIHTVLSGFQECLPYLKGRSEAWNRKDFEYSFQIYWNTDRKKTTTPSLTAVFISHFLITPYFKMCLIFRCLMEHPHFDLVCYYYFAWNRQHQCEIHVKTKNIYILQEYQSLLKTHLWSVQRISLLLIMPLLFPYQCQGINIGWLCWHDYRKRRSQQKQKCTSLLFLSFLSLSCMCYFTCCSPRPRFASLCECAMGGWTAHYSWGCSFTLWFAWLKCISLALPRVRRIFSTQYNSTTLQIVKNKWSNKIKSKNSA